MINIEMKTLNKFGLLVWTLVAVFFVSSCESDDPEPGDEDQNGSWNGYVVGFRATDGDASADYILTVDDLMTGSISATGQGVEQAGWSYYAQTGDKYFSVGYTLQECIGYEVDQEGELALDSKFIFERIDCMNALNDDSFLGIGAPWGGGSFDCQLQVIDANDISISKTVIHPIYEAFYQPDTLDAPLQLNAWPTDSYLSGDKLFVSFYPLHGTSWQTPLTDKAQVSVYSYPEMKFIETIEDERTSPVGYYGDQPAFIEAEDALYTISTSSYFAGFTQVTRPSGILKIDLATGDFNEDYFFNVEEDYGFKILTAAYVGDGKAIARVSVADDDNISTVGQWQAFGNYDVLRVVILDMQDETLTEVTDIPVHAGQYQTPFLLEEGKVYMSIRQNATGEAYVYRIDPGTATAEQGARIDGIELQAMYKHNG